MTVFVLFFLLLTSAFAQDDAPQLFGSCLGTSGSATACVGETITCISRLHNDTLEDWTVTAATVNGTDVLTAPTVVVPGDTFDGAQQIIVNFADFVTVPTTITAVNAAGAESTASLDAFINVTNCPTPMLRAARRLQRQRTYRVRCVNHDAERLRVCTDTHGQTWTAKIE